MNKKLKFECNKYLEIDRPQLFPRHQQQCMEGNRVWESYPSGHLSKTLSLNKIIEIDIKKLN